MVIVLTEANEPHDLVNNNSIDNVSYAAFSICWAGGDIFLSTMFTKETMGNL